MVDSPIFEERPDLFRDSIGVAVFAPGQFHVTAADVFVGAGSVEEVHLKQDVTDKVSPVLYFSAF